jgi:hypothetical protein
MFPGQLVMPVDPSEMRAIEFASSAIELGEFVDAPREFYEVPMNQLSVEYLEREIRGRQDYRWAEGPRSRVSGAIRGAARSWSVGGVFDAPLLRLAPAELVEQLQQVAETEARGVPFAADRSILRSRGTPTTNLHRWHEAARQLKFIVKSDAVTTFANTPLA